MIEAVKKAKFELTGFAVGGVIVIVLVLFLRFLPVGNEVLLHLSTYERLLFGIVMAGIPFLCSSVSYFLKRWLYWEEPPKKLGTEQEPLIQDNNPVTLNPAPLGINIKNGMKVYLNESDIPAVEKIEYINRLDSLYSEILPLLCKNPDDSLIFNDRRQSDRLVSDYHSFVSRYNYDKRNETSGRFDEKSMSHQCYIDEYKITLQLECAEFYRLVKGEVINEIPIPTTDAFNNPHL